MRGLGLRRPFVQINLAAFKLAVPVLIALTLTGLQARAGILVVRTTKGFQFVEAVSVAVNGRDKVANLGGNAKASITTNKLPSLKLGGVLLRDANSGVVTLNSDGLQTFIGPESLPKGISVTPSSAWTDAQLTYRKSSSEKTPIELPIATFAAFLPGGVDELVSLCRNDRTFKALDSSDNSFTTRLDLITATAKTFRSDPAIKSLQGYVEESMRSRYADFENGSADFATLSEALRFADVSASAFPQDAEQVKLREQILARKVWLDEKLVILRTFAAGEEWDQFILCEQGFESYEHAFPDVAALHVKALKSSLEQHKTYGEELIQEQEYGPALKQFRLAGYRLPSDKLIQQRITSAWANYSRERAIDRKADRKQLGLGEREILNQAIQFASNYKEENKLDLALKSIQDAEAVDPQSLPMLLKKAEILGAQGDFAHASATLDKYDLLAVDEERDKAAKLRNELLFRQRSRLEDAKEQIHKAWTTAAYYKARDLAIRGLQAKDDDPELLLDAGTATLITREPERSRGFLSRYLAVTGNLDADNDQRAKVRTFLAAAPGPTHAESGTRNWLSGKKLPPNVFYDPISLAFQPEIDRIETSGKMKVAYDWRGDQLISITPTFEKADRATNEKKIAFVYNDHFPQVLSAVDGDAALPKFNSADPDDVVRHSSLVLLNNPYIDPQSAQQLMGANLAKGISGNRFFEPFVWDKIHYFHFTYDQAGRVSQATEMNGIDGASTGLVLTFEWSGQQLRAIRGFEGSDSAHRTQVYQRTLQYSDDQLVGEEIEAAGKSSHIKYSYNGGRMTSAHCSNDPTLDDRSRVVTFR